MQRKIAWLSRVNTGHGKGTEAMHPAAPATTANVNR